ncbi:MAG TPA: hypothetical protein VGU25_05915 [Acidobacteriaceae bacterium]|nr:hypothetical protein [Acidobacteriaceae bacterium]
MNGLIECGTFAPLTMTDHEMLRRAAMRYSELVRERDYLLGLMFLAVRTGDTNLKATTKKRLADAEIECNKCYAALRGGGQETLSEAA